MEQRLLPIHLCPQCGSIYSYMFLDEECPNCNYKFEKEESLNMIAHCPYCIGDELTMRIGLYWDRVLDDSALNEFYTILKENTEKSYVEIAAKHMEYILLINHFENFASKGIFELRCEQCGKELCVEGNNFVLLMKDVGELNLIEDKEISQEPHISSMEETGASRKGCTVFVFAYFIILISFVLVSCIIG